MQSITRILTLLFLVWSTSSHAFDTQYLKEHELNWRPNQTAKVRDGINTYVARLEGESTRAFRGDTEVPYALLPIIAVMMDVDAFPEWVYQLNHVEREQHTNQPKHFYLAFNRVWPTRARDVGVYSEVVHNTETGIVDMYTYNTNDYYPERKGYVRIPRLYNHWRLTPMADNWTKVEFETFVDIGGSIPKWLVNMVSKSAPKKTLVNLRRQLDTGRYNIDTAAELPFIPEGLYLE